MWRLKILAKIVLARLPIPYSFWRKIGLFRHGKMDQYGYPLKIFRLHAGRVFPEHFPSGAVCLELGPGDSIASAILARAYGAQKIWLLDVGRFASGDVGLYQALVSYLENTGMKNLPDLSGCKTIEDVLTACNATYLTHGLQSLDGIPDQSVDFIWSHSVLEHVRRKDFYDLMRGLHRVLKKGGCASHNIDLQDHLDHGLNNLRFPEWFWENEIVANSGFYTNRLQHDDITRFMKQAGFEITFEEVGKWPSLPICLTKIAHMFRDKSPDILSIRTSSLILKP